RLRGGMPVVEEARLRMPLPAVAARTFLAQLNLDRLPHPGEGWCYVLVAGSLGAVILAPLVFFAVTAAKRRAGHSTPSPRSAMLFGGVWALLGWAPVFMPSIGWHAYYGSLGTLGAWTAIGIALRHRRLPATGLVIALSFLLAARAVTPSWDWGEGWYQMRAG